MHTPPQADTPTPCPSLSFLPGGTVCCDAHDEGVTRAALVEHASDPVAAVSWYRLRRAASASGTHPSDMLDFFVGCKSLTAPARSRLRSYLREQRQSEADAKHPDTRGWVPARATLPERRAPGAGLSHGAPVASEGHSRDGGVRLGPGVAMAQHLETDPEADDRVNRLMAPVRAGVQAQLDAPPCSTCGDLMVRNASCYRCLGCGESGGCS